MTPRNTKISILYEGTDITKDIAGYVEDFSYTDAEDKSDSLSLTLNNISWQWLAEWEPKLGDRIEATIISDAGDDDITEFYCGEFVVDDVSYSGRPLVCTLSAVSSPVDEAFKSEKKTKNWEGVTLSQIASEIAAAAGLTLDFQAEDIGIKSEEQTRKADSDFLKGLCDTYGYIMKTYAKKLVIADPAVMETMDPVAKMSEERFSNWTYDSTIGGSYTGVVLEYTDSKGNKYSAALGDIEKRCLRLNEKCDDNTDAARIAKGKVNKENEGMYTLSAKLRHPEFLSSTQVISLSGMKNMDGNYYLRSVKHKVSKGYEVSIEARKVVERIGKPVEQPVNYPTLRYGDKDSTKDGYVSIMQQALVNKGFALPIFGVDGLFFSETKQCVINCQTANGIQVDGICGPETWGVLMG